MSIFTDPPITWTPDTVCDDDAINKELHEKLDDIDTFAATCITLIDRIVTQLDVVNTTDETDFYTFNIPANLLSTNKAVRLTLIGDYLAHGNAAGDTVTIKIYLRTTIIYQDISYAQYSISRMPVFIQLLLANQNATNIQILGGLIQLGSLGGASIGIGDLTGYAITANTPLFGTAAEATNVDKIFKVTVQHNRATANTSIRRQWAMLELI